MSRKAKLIHWLPPTPVTPEMREAVVAIADKEQESIAEIQRRAFAFFLLENERKAKTKTAKLEKRA